MPIALLDVNVLLALAFPAHVHHQATHKWFQHAHTGGWATCPLTELGFLRLCMQPAVVKIPLLFVDAMQSLRHMRTAANHHFWPQEIGLGELNLDIQSCVMGHNQLTDAVLLDLAIKNNGRLATLDRKIQVLLGASSNPQQSLIVIES